MYNKKENVDDTAQVRIITDFQSAIVETHELLKENHEWIERYAGYAKIILGNQQFIEEMQSKFAKWPPFKFYLTTTNAKNAKKSVKFEMRCLGQTVAILTCSLDNTTISTEGHDKSNKKYYGCEIRLPRGSKWSGNDSDDAKAFRKYFKEYYNKHKKSFEEHRLESLLLTEFAKSTKNKKLKYIQPVRIAKMRYPMPTPLKASAAGKKEGVVKYVGAKGGGIDIFCRVGSGNKKSLCIIELKDEHGKVDPPYAAIKQALVYTTFIRELLRSDSGNDWWNIFGFGDKDVPKSLVLNAVCAMPGKGENPPCVKLDGDCAHCDVPNRDCATAKSFADVVFVIDDEKGKDAIKLHYLYFKEVKDKNGKPLNIIEAINSSLSKIESDFHEHIILKDRAIDRFVGTGEGLIIEYPDGRIKRT